MRESKASGSYESGRTDLRSCMFLAAVCACETVAHCVRALLLTTFAPPYAHHRKRASVHSSASLSECPFPTTKADRHRRSESARHSCDARSTTLPRTMRSFCTSPSPRRSQSRNRMCGSAFFFAFSMHGRVFCDRRLDPSASLNPNS